MTHDATVTTYFPGEGREFMRECIAAAADECVRAGLSHLVIFTGTGEGPRYVATELLPLPKYERLRVAAVTPPFGRPYRANPGDSQSPLVHAGINPAMRDELSALGIDVVAAHLPFKEMFDGKERSSPWTRVAEAYGVLGGGFALCVQAVLVACDGGIVQAGERVVVASADTALVVVASRTETFLSPHEGLLVEHILCRPSRYSISKRQHVHFAPAAPSPGQAASASQLTAEATKALPAADHTKPKTAKAAAKPKRVTSTPRLRKPSGN